MSRDGLLGWCLPLDGLHRVRTKVEPSPCKTILPPDVFEKYAGLSFWQDLQNCAAFRITAKPQDSAEQSAEG